MIKEVFMEDTTNTQYGESNEQVEATENPISARPVATLNKQYSKSVTILIYCFVFFPLFFITGQFIFIAMFFLTIYSLILAMAGMMNPFKQVFCCSILITLACLSVWISLALVGNQISNGWPFSEYDDEIAESIISNTLKADDKKQAIENWCDLIREKKDISGWILGGSDTEEIWSNTFVLNKGAADLIVAGEKVPDDMIFLFKGTEGWNQTGGKDKLATSYKHNSIPMLMGNFETKYISPKKIDRLKWDVDDTAQSLANTSIMPIYTLNAAVIAAGVCVLVLRRRHAIRYAILAVLGAAASATAGYFFSQFGCEALYIGEPSKLTDFTTVYIISAVVGAAFILLLAPSIAGRISREELFFKTALLAGLCGLAASTLIHIYIMIYKETTNPLGILGGAGYGIYAGIVLGVVTYWLIRLWHRIRRPVNAANNQPPRPSGTPPFQGGEQEPTQQLLPCQGEVADRPEGF